MSAPCAPGLGSSHWRRSTKRRTPRWCEATTCSAWTWRTRTLPALRRCAAATHRALALSSTFPRLPPLGLPPLAVPGSCRSIPRCADPLAPGAAPDHRPGEGPPGAGRGRGQGAAVRVERSLLVAGTVLAVNLWLLSFPSPFLPCRVSNVYCQDSTVTFSRVVDSYKGTSTRATSVD